MTTPRQRRVTRGLVYHADFRAPVAATKTVRDMAGGATMQLYGDAAVSDGLLSYDGNADYSRVQVAGVEYRSIVFDIYTPNSYAGDETNPVRIFFAQPGKDFPFFGFGSASALFADETLTLFTATADSSSTSGASYIKDTISAGRHTIAAVYNGSYYELWLDGAIPAQYQHKNGTHQLGAALITGINMEWGGRSKRSNWYTGNLGSLRIYDRAISLAEFQTINQAGRQ